MSYFVVQEGNNSSTLTEEYKYSVNGISSNNNTATVEHDGTINIDNSNNANSAGHVSTAMSHMGMSNVLSPHLYLGNISPTMVNLAPTTASVAMSANNNNNVSMSKTAIAAGDERERLIRGMRASYVDAQTTSKTLPYILQGTNSTAIQQQKQQQQ
uniref:Uncharacterized protein n=1 Tax=Lygus hesperus TaxID=30085 RepID=A0A0A9ZH60_LYGHE